MDLVWHRVGIASQPRAHLQWVFPAVVGWFAELDRPISLRFLARFDCQDRVDWLSVRRLDAWLRSAGYCARVSADVPHARLVAAPRGATGDFGLAATRVTRCVVTALSTLVEQIKTLVEQISEQLQVPTDACIFTSLPRSGRVRAARPLAEIGGCRARFPTPEALFCLAGAAPTTRPSGNYTDAIGRGHDHPHAVGMLARAWLHIIWHCWQHRVADDPAKHKALQAVLARQRPAAA
jgi:Flp pilus assembly pilin Flp